MTDSIQPREPALSPKATKRTRVQLSCTACRSRKLKCCRTHPCANCKKRGDANSCTFVGRGPRGRPSHGQSNPSQVQDRLQHLENLIFSLAQKKRHEENQTQNVAMPHSDLESQAQSIVPNPSSNPELPTKSPSTGQPGKLVVKDAGTRYIDDAHWTAILQEINEVRESLQEDDGLTDDEDIEENNSNYIYPILLFGLIKSASKEELLADLPPRPVTDRLISIFLNSREPFLVILHIPTFQKEYNLFWSAPHSVSLAWLGMLYAFLAIAILFTQRSGCQLPGSLGDPSDAQIRFRKRSAQCLVQSNYIVPGKYKVEALFLHTMGEFFQSFDAQIGITFLFGIVIKLSMRMGYHRDPKHYPALSPFNGEMRRRVWSVLLQLDILLSFQTGFPRTIQAWQHDVELPSNLSDDDYNELTEQLPPPRPDNEVTTTSYARCKSRMTSIFGRVLDLAYSREPITYDQTLELDRRLEEDHKLIAPVYRMRPINQCLADPSDLIFRRYNLEIMYQKTRCVLHRRYLSEVHSNLQYLYSRAVCIDASKEILRCQAEIFRESEPGGLLSRDRPFPSSLQHGDYLLAAMILCTELAYNRVGSSQMKGYAKDIGMDINGDLLSTLEMSYSIFEKTRLESADAQKAYAALTVMLRRVKQGLTIMPPPKSSASHSGTTNNPVVDSAAAFLEPPQYGSWQNLDSPLYPLNGATTSIQDSIMTLGTSSNSLDVIGDMLETPANLDWRLWDEQVRFREEFDLGSGSWDAS